jgi:hypothetical protein
MSQPQQSVIRHLIEAKGLAGILGCGKRRVLEELLEAERQSFLGGYQDIGPVLEQAVLEGVPFPGLDREDTEHEHAAMRLAYSCVARKEPFDSMVAIPAWQAGVRVAASVLPEGPERMLAGFLGAGRALFGARPTSFGPVYAFLSAEETAALAKALSGAPAGPVRESVATAARQRAGLFVLLPFALA